MPPARVLVLYNEPVLPPDHPDADSEHEIVHTVDVVSHSLTAAGFMVSRLGAGRYPAALLAGLRDHRPDVVFNLFEGMADHGHTEATVAGLLEWLGLPFTGCPSHPLCLARNKPLAKHFFRGADLPTPDFFVVEKLPLPHTPAKWPVIAKPATEDASVGLDQGSVVGDRKRLRERVAALLQRYGPPVLVEEYIEGREFNVGLVATPKLRTLPISEIMFSDKEPGCWPIVTYDAKWKPDSRDFKATPPRCPADVSPRLAATVTDLARRAFQLLGCRDYARVDFRIRPPDRPFILEVNPNPDLSPSAGLAYGLEAAGVTHAQFAVDLIRTALARTSVPAS
jgi:D-alanine-D-alanine ligase